MAEEGEKQVVLNVYDLSSGLAAQLSTALLGKQVEGVWHTGIVYDGVEYYYGPGIQTAPAGGTPFGAPLRVVSLGSTKIPNDIFQEYIAELSNVWTPEAYSLFENNCNNFTDEVAGFLTGRSIPDYITALPKEVLATPFGQMLAPGLGGVQGRLNSPPHPPRNPASPFSVTPENVTAAVTDSLRAATATVVADTGMPLTKQASQALSQDNKNANIKSLSEASQAFAGKQGNAGEVVSSLGRSSLASDVQHAKGTALKTTAGFPAPVSRRLTIDESGEIITRLGSGQLTRMITAQTPRPQISPRVSMRGNSKLPSENSRRMSGSNISIDGPKEPKDGTKAQPGPSSAKSVGMNARVSYSLERTHSGLPAGPKAEFEAKVRQEFASIMAKGGSSPNEAAAQAIQRAAAISPSAA